MKLLYDLQHDINKFHWNRKLEPVIQQIETFFKNYVTLSLPNTNHSFSITVAFSLSVEGCLLFQMFGKGKLDFLSNNTGVFNTNELKLCTIYRELTGIVYSLTIYEHIIVGSDYFIIVLKDHKPVHSRF